VVLSIRGRETGKNESEILAMSKVEGSVGAEAPATTEKHLRRIAAFFLVLSIFLALGVRYRLLETPLERDEGEYAYAGSLLLSGVPPYHEAHHMKLPGVYAAYAAVLRLFGKTISGIHTGLLVINMITVLFLYLLARRLLRFGGAVVAAALFAFLSLGQAVQGVFANAEHFVLLFAVPALWVFVAAMDRESTPLLFSSSVLFGFAFLMKQHGALFFAFGAVYLLIDGCRRREGAFRWLLPRFLSYIAGALIVYGLLCLMLWRAGVFERFWFWTVEYARAYIDQRETGEVFVRFWNAASEVAGASPLLWVWAVLGVLLAATAKEGCRRGDFLLLLGLFSLLAVTPGFHFRPHYFVLLLPAAALLAGAAAACAGSVPISHHPSISRDVVLGLIVVCLALTTIQQRAFLFEMTPIQVNRATYGLNPFIESVEIARYIRARTGEEEKIAVIGSEPQIYFYADRRAATGFIYTYPLMEEHENALRMQEEMIREIEEARPAYLVYVRNLHSWGYRAESHTRILDWFQEYRRGYDLVGLVDMFPKGTRYYWAPDVRWPPRSECWIAVMERKNR